MLNVLRSSILAFFFHSTCADVLNVELPSVTQVMQALNIMYSCVSLKRVLFMKGMLNEIILC